MTRTMTAIAVAFAGTALASAPANAQRDYGAQPQQQPAQQSQSEAPAENPNAIKSHMPKISREAGKAMQELQKAVNDKNTAAIPAAVAAAQAAAKTGDDRYVIALLQLKAAAGANDKAGIASAIEAMLASGSVTAEEKYGLYLNLAQIYDGMKQDARAMQAYSQALQVNPNSVDATAGMAESLASQGQPAKAIELLQKGIALQSAGGAKAPEPWYKRAVAVAYKAKLPVAADLSRKWIAAYPTTDAWQNALAIYQNLGQLEEAKQLDLLRLKGAVGALTEGDYFNYGDIAVRRGFSGEAKAVLEKGFAANKISKSDSSFSQLYGLAAARTKGDKESLAVAPVASANARQTLNLGDAWFGYGDYAKAAEFYRAALAKPDADKDLINLHLGMALTRQGDKAGAVAALNAAGGAQAELAQYWLLYANTHA